ncbi:hypothetical protein BJ742DRAFT_858231 [Cladochytrium replicatum]|nr:hypothetical protein BJ742DRAFT_858231 [Cladochytrium replicatum]
MGGLLCWVGPTGSVATNSVSRTGQPVEELASLSRQITETLALTKVLGSLSSATSGHKVSRVTSVSRTRGWDGDMLVNPVLGETVCKRRKTEAAVGEMSEAMGTIAENIHGGNSSTQTAGPDSFTQMMSMMDENRRRD